MFDKILKFLPRSAFRMPTGRAACGEGDCARPRIQPSYLEDRRTSREWHPCSYKHDLSFFVNAITHLKRILAIGNFKGRNQ